MVQAIISSSQERRKEWMLRLLEQASTANRSNTKYQFWSQDNQPKELFRERFSHQKLEYIHNNPVEAGILNKAQDYVYHSVRDY